MKTFFFLATSLVLFSCAPNAEATGPVPNHGTPCISGFANIYPCSNVDFLGRLDPDTPAPTGYAEERIASPETARVRDVVEAPDGAIWFLSVGNGTAYRLVPQP